MKKNRLVNIQIKIIAYVLFVNLFSLKLHSQIGKEYFNKANEQSDSGNYEGAIINLTKCIYLESCLAEAYYNRGLAKADIKDYEGAILDFDKCILLNPNLIDAFYNRGRSKYFVSDLLGCILDNNIAIMYKPTFALAYINRGLAQALLGNINESCWDFCKAKELNAPHAQEILNYYCK